MTARYVVLKNVLLSTIEVWVDVVRVDLQTALFCGECSKESRSGRYVASI